MKKDLHIYKVTWYNGYYQVSRDIVSHSVKGAIKEAKRIYGGYGEKRYANGAFSKGENPAMKCGLYGEPWATLSLKNVSRSKKSIERNKLMKKHVSGQGSKSY